ncbi:hypothetical protein OG612_39020 [Streptomyces sp. NBC_01527]|uniref:hypothetical protein n=1 Tax=unclassified Streptomyces TaxID=2593676 RepID=UPI002E1401DA|nr:hypothetical protein OG763_03920 [Streptomyces sp. NBC_01230]
MDDEHDYGAHGAFGDRSHTRAPQLWLSHHRALTASLLAGAMLAGAWAGRRMTECRLC